MTMSVFVAACIGAVLGVVIGVLVARASTVARSSSNPSDGDGVHEEVERVGAVLDALSTGVVIVDPEGRVISRNASARSFVGTHAGVLIDETVERHLEMARGGVRPDDELLELYGPPKMVVVVRASPLPGGGAFAFVEDISERRRIDAVRTDFVANISHELKTPVGALAVLAETLVDESDPDIVGRLAERLLDEAHRTARTIDDLLELSRIELGDDQMREGVDVADVIRCAVERGEALAEQRAIRITVLDTETPGQSLSVPGDRRQLISAVGNLVENAVKYSEPEGQVQIRARSEGPWVEFMVADQGVGIPARDLDRIFERFYRVDKARSRGTGGSGLGLSIVRHVATNHGGEVLVSSSEGEGSTFVLRIPRTSHDALPSHATSIQRGGS
jgi:two-component system, OmpR family, sensor histidine kinase SenX3